MKEGKIESAIFFARTFSRSRCAKGMCSSDSERTQASPTLRRRFCLFWQPSPPRYWWFDPLATRFGPLFSCCTLCLVRFLCPTVWVLHAETVVGTVTLSVDALSLRKKISATRRTALGRRRTKARQCTKAERSPLHRSGRQGIQWHLEKCAKGIGSACGPCNAVQIAKDLIFFLLELIKIVTTFFFFFADRLWIYKSRNGEKSPAVIFVRLQIVFWNRHRRDISFFDTTTLVFSPHNSQLIDANTDGTNNTTTTIMTTHYIA